MRIALALQGGGAHGAYTWGVLDRLLREPDFDLDAVSGASAGAVNGVVLLEGLRLSGTRGARQLLERVWTAISGRSQLAELLGAPISGYRNHAIHHATMRGAAKLTRWMSAEQINPLGLDPLRDILDDCIDFKRFNNASGPAFYVAATDVKARRGRIFSRSEMSPDVIMASACLPHLQRGVSIEGRVYWDGGLTSNPPLWPLVRQSSARRIVLVSLSANREIDDLSTTEAVRGELTELSFELPLAAELESIAHAKAMAQASWLTLGEPIRRLRQLQIDTMDHPSGLVSLIRSARWILRRHFSKNCALLEKGLRLLGWAVADRDGNLAARGGFIQPRLR